MKAFSGNKKNRKIKYAVIGAGYISQAAMIPSFLHARNNSELTALVSGDPIKRKNLQRRYGIPHAFGYEEYEQLLDSGLVDAVYIGLPNSMHREYAVRAAKAGIHVLCEKPMAVTADDCEEMIRSAKQNQVKLMIAYRLHFDRLNLQVIQKIREGKIGEPRIFNSTFSMQVKTGDIRLKKVLGGGPLYDIGIYCLNAARYLFGSEPYEVSAFEASKDEKRFSQIPEMNSVMMKFPGEKIAAFSCSFGASDTGFYQVVGTKGNLRVESVYEYAEPRTVTLTAKGRTEEKEFKVSDQFAPELLYFSDCILKGKDPEPSGEEGLRDIRVIEAIKHSVKIGRSVTLPPQKRTGQLDPKQQIFRPRLEKPRLIHASSPHRE